MRLLHTKEISGEGSTIKKESRSQIKYLKSNEIDKSIKTLKVIVHFSASFNEKGFSF